MSNILPSTSTLHAILESAPGHIVYTDLEMNIRYINLVDHGFKMEDVIGTNYLAFLTEEQGNKVKEAFAAARKTGEQQHFENFIDPPSGKRQWYSALISLLRDDDGSDVGFVVITTEVTAQKKAELELERTREELMEASHRAGMAEVATGVLHNVGNVLNSVNVSTSTISEQLGASRIGLLTRATQMLSENEGSLAEFLTADPRGKKLPALLVELSQELGRQHDRLESEVARLSEFVGLMRSTVVAQQSMARTGQVIEAVAPSVLVDRTLALFRIELEQQAIKTTVECEATEPFAMDKAAVVQILANVVRNAIEALAGVEEPALGVRVKVVDEQVVFEIEDNGCGIAEDNMLEIFQHGFTTKADGHGFGLHASAIAAKTMHGMLTIDSDGLGKGARARLSLPQVTA